jgi:hypothetical protein
VRAATIASLVAKWKRGEDLPTSRSIILVDEVSKLGTAWGADLLRVASERGAQVGPPAATVQKFTLRTRFLVNSGRLSGDFGAKAAR